MTYYCSFNMPHHNILASTSIMFIAHEPKALAPLSIDFRVRIFLLSNNNKHHPKTKEKKI